MGMRRLSIVDLPGGSQPVWNEAQNLAVIFNGEIYNFRELRLELESRGHRFHTRSDTETIVHAYEEWGASCAGRLRGMFAFAVVEMPLGPAGPTARVFLARDSLGIKPLYYAAAGGRLIFASEVRALLASGCIAARLEPAAIPAYLLFGSVCEPLTLVEGVRSLPPGYSMMVEAGAPIVNVEAVRYWHFTLPDVHKARAATAEAQHVQGTDEPSHRVRALLEDAVATHLVADVPVGVFLSSGLDSTALAALASRVQRGIHTFTVAFTDRAFSEAEIARRTAKALGTEHSELTLRWGDGRPPRQSYFFVRPTQHGRHQYVFRFLGGAPGGFEGGAFRIGQRRTFWRVLIVSRYAQGCASHGRGAHVAAWAAQHAGSRIRRG